MKQKKNTKKEVKGKGILVVFCFFTAINFYIHVKVLTVPVRIMSGVGVGTDGIWFVFGFVSLSPLVFFSPARKLAGLA